MADTDRQVFAICIAAAAIFWLILNLSQDYTVRREVKLDYVVDPERVLVGSMPENIETDVTGQGWALVWESLRPGALPVPIDLREQGNNTRLTTAELKQQIERRLSSGALTVGYMDFESIPILTTPLAGKRVPIVPDIRIRTKKGFIVVDSLYLSPDSITINAAGDELEEITSWPTVILNVNELDGRVEGPIQLARPKGNIVLGREEVLYSVRAEPYIQQTITVPVEIVNAPRGQRYEVTPGSVDVTVSVPQSSFQRVNAREFRVVADVSKLRDGNFSPSVALELLEQPKNVVSAYLGKQVVTYYAIQ